MKDNFPKPPAKPLDKNRDLFFSALQGDTARVKELIAAGADVNTRQVGLALPVLYASAEAGRLESVKLLVEAGAKLEDATLDGRTPLIVAVRAGHTEVAQYLMSKGAKTKTIWGSENLIEMAERCDDALPMIRVLLGAMDDDARSDAFLKAAADGKSNIVTVALMMKDFDIHCRDVMGNTALHLAVQNAGKPEAAAHIVRLLLKRGLDIEAENDTQETALCAAMTKRPVAHEPVQALVEAGADIMRKNLAGISNYDAAQLTGNEKLIPFFEAAKKQHVLREVRKVYEGTGNKMTVRKPLQPKKPEPPKH